MTIEINVIIPQYRNSHLQLDSAERVRPIVIAGTAGSSIRHEALKLPQEIPVELCLH